MIGSIVLLTALASSVIAMIMFFLSYRGYKNTLNYGRIAYHVMAMLVIVASTILWYAILTHNYSYHYVFNYSKNSLSTGFLIASFWGGQEGSFMLWLLLTSIIGIILQSYTSKRGDLEPRVMAVFTLSTTFLLIMVSPWFKNPFAYIWADPTFIDVKKINAAILGMPFMQNFIFSDGQSGTNFVKVSSDLYAKLAGAGISIRELVIDGKGLNPQLLNFWMQIHPPILFTGFAMATVPFAFAMAALMKNDYRFWVKQSFPWVLAGAGILGLGIMLGGYWAYEMLGWGGYWAWDPVENSSLIPWLVGVASIHTFLVQRRTQVNGKKLGRFAKTNLILSILTYVLVLYSTFLTRSGILGDASVHSFVDPGMMVYLFLIIFIGTFIVLGFGMIIYRWKYLSKHSVEDESLLSRDLALFTSAVVLCASALVVLVGTSAPIFGHSVDTFFYSEMNLPIAIIIGLLNGLSLLLKWKQTKGQDIIKKSIFSVSATLLTTILMIVFAGITDVMMILLALSASFAFWVNVEIAVKIVRGNMKMLGAYVAHIGIALFILGVIGSAAYSSEVDVNLVKGEPQQAFGYKMTFTGYEPIENNTKYAFHIDMTKGDKSYRISPVMYISDFNNSLMREPAILSLMTKDVYISPLGYDENKGNNQNGTQVTLHKGNSTDFNGVKLTFVDYDFPEKTREAMMAGKDFKIGVKLQADVKDRTEKFEIALQNINGQREFTSHTLQNAGVKVKLVNLNATGQVDLALSKVSSEEKTEVKKPQEVLSITASVKPFINLVWGGVLVMVFGFFISVARRLKESMVKEN